MALGGVSGVFEDEKPKWPEDSQDSHHPCRDDETLFHALVTSVGTSGRWAVRWPTGGRETSRKPPGTTPV